MTKGEQTREMILSTAAEAFNRLGYSGTSLSDIMGLTGLEKGGIYNHFASKEDLAVQAFDYAFDRVSRVMLGVIRTAPRTAEAQLRAMINYFTDYIEHPPVPGGCPVLNTAIESDDANPALRARARNAMDDWRKLVIRLVEKGIAKNEFKPDVVADQVATLLLASLEGGIMLSKLYGDTSHTESVVAQMNAYVDEHLLI
jgi:TetR/AcrR family transcriptional regulator, transcriptional repressor for nem operon